MEHCLAVIPRDEVEVVLAEQLLVEGGDQNGVLVRYGEPVPQHQGGGLLSTWSQLKNK